MKRFFVLSVLVISMLAVTGLAQNDPPPGFPFVENFDNMSEWTLTGHAFHEVGSGWVRLTRNIGFQSGLAVLNIPFSSSYGITVEFDFYAGGGTGADGIAFFLVDGTTNPVTPGAYGCALGYACYGDGRAPGVPNGYVGIGLDELGNYLTRCAGHMGLPGGVINDTVTIRGSGNGILGYNYLTHALTAQYGGIDGNWRRTRITVTQGELISVQMSWDGGNTWVPLINNYNLSTAPGQAPLPETFKLGFSAGTGWGTNYHLIDNLEVSVPVDVAVDVIQQPGGPFCTGETVEYQYSVTNLGPNGSNSIEVTENIPAGLENVSWNYTTDLGDYGNGEGNVIAPTLDLDCGEVATFTVTGTVAPGASGSLAHDMSADPGLGFNDPTPDNGLDTVVMMVYADTEAPVPDVAVLPIVTGECSAEITTFPTATDNCAGTITGDTTDPLTYTEQGTYTVTWTFDDGNGNVAVQEQNVIVQDTTAPGIISILANPNTLWPPNHKMVAVTVSVETADNCDSATTGKIISVESNEPIDGLGDGDTSPDWEITGDLTLNLRAERSGKGNGRIYTITVECKDAPGNTTTGTVTVVVPKSQKK